MPELPADDTEGLINSARGGSTAALGELFERCRNYLLVIATSELGDDLHPKVHPTDDALEEKLTMASIELADRLAAAFLRKIGSA